MTTPSARPPRRLGHRAGGGGNCQRAVEQTVTGLGGLDVLVNNVATQEPVADLAELSTGPSRTAAPGSTPSLPDQFWTPLIPATLDRDRVGSSGSQVPMGRAAHPDEIAPSYVFFASGQLSSYYSGEVLAPPRRRNPPGVSTRARPHFRRWTT